MTKNSCVDNLVFSDKQVLLSLMYGYIVPEHRERLVEIADGRYLDIEGNEACQVLNHPYGQEAIIRTPGDTYGLLVHKSKDPEYSTFCHFINGRPVDEATWGIDRSTEIYNKEKTKGSIY